MTNGQKGKPDATSLRNPTQFSGYFLVSRPVPFKEPLPANSQSVLSFQRNNAMNAMETIDGEPCICIE
jgi:hypothetical protein